MKRTKQKYLSLSSYRGRLHSVESNLEIELLEMAPPLPLVTMTPQAVDDVVARALARNNEAMQRIILDREQMLKQTYEAEINNTQILSLGLTNTVTDYEE